MELIEMMRHRRSVRQYTQEPVTEEKLELVLQAGLLSASGKAIRPWEFIVVHDKKTLEQMSGCRTSPLEMMKAADYAIAVVADTSKTDVWTEDCSVAMANMHLMADSLGLGSCWVQGRLREASNGQTTEDFLRAILGFPKEYALEAILLLGMPQNHPEPYQLSELPGSKIHREHF